MGISCCAPPEWGLSGTRTGETKWLTMGALLWEVFSESRISYFRSGGYRLRKCLKVFFLAPQIRRNLVPFSGIKDREAESHYLQNNPDDTVGPEANELNAGFELPRKSFLMCVSLSQAVS